MADTGVRYPLFLRTEFYDQVKASARAAGVSVSAWIRQAMAEKLARQAMAEKLARS
jgi:hypothetical protein